MRATKDKDSGLKWGVWFVLIFVVIGFFAWRMGIVPRTNPVAAPERPTASPLPTLVIYNWEEYTDREVLKQFEQETGIAVTLKEYGQAFEMFSVVESDPSQFDIIITDGPSVLSLIQARLVDPLDHAKLPNFVHIKQELKHLYFDPENTYSIPYLYGTTGLGVNTKFVTTPVTSWQVIYDPIYRGKIALFDDPRELMTAVLKSLRYSVNTTDPQQLSHAEEQVQRLKANAVILSDYYPLQQQLIEGSLWIVMAYSGDLVKTQAPPEIAYVIPEEGSNRWVDNYVVSAHSRNRDAAHAFLDFVMRPEIAAKISNSQFYATPNATAEGLLDPAVRTNPIIYPDPRRVVNLEYIMDVGDTEREYNRLHSLMHTPSP
jgi:spermidine/putrescine transport system substrate-binding protein